MNYHQLFYSVVAMNALFSSLAWCAAKPNRASILSVVLFAVIWPFVDTPLEGHVLISFNKTQGITESDLLSVLAIVVAAIQIVRHIRRSTPRMHNRWSYSSAEDRPAEEDQPLGR